MFGRAVRWVIGGTILAVGSAVAGAAVAKRRLPSVGTEASNEIALTGILAPLEFESRATAFRGGTALVWFGGGDIDLRGATLDPDGARLEVRAIFGGGRLIVPETWQVDLRIRGVFGGSADTRTSYERAPDAPHLIVDGLAVFGGIAIVSSRPEVDLAIAGDIAED